MSVVFLHIGQCGIQIGEELWLRALQQSQSDDDVNHVMFSTKYEPRAVFCDAERKVLKQFCRRMKALKGRTKFNVLEHSVRMRKGCGSNWSLGFNDLPSTEIGIDIPVINAGFGKFYADSTTSVLDVTKNMIRLKVEKCDSFSGFIGVQSLGGGTGSGYGSRICEELSDLYPTAYRLWTAVAPHSIGDSPMQSYNQLLSLSKLQESSDGILLYENDQVLERLLKKCENVSIKQMNEYIADSMLALFLPVSSLTPTSGGMSIGIEPWELIRSVVPMPSLKLLKSSSVKQTSSAADTWDKMKRSLLTQVRHHVREREEESCVASLCVCRGLKREEDSTAVDITQKLKKIYKYVAWNPYPVDLWIDHVPEKSKRSTRSITLCSNMVSTGTSYCRTVLDRSRKMLQSGAYTHWYSRYGTNMDDFNAAFNTFEEIISNYEESNK